MIPNMLHMLGALPVDRFHTAWILLEVGLILVKPIARRNACSRDAILAEKGLHDVRGHSCTASLDQICFPHRENRMPLQKTLHKVWAWHVINKPRGSAL